ncbi:MAG: hypothetical protein VX613_01180, partial [Candidatus Thermoplasmatota archaeon]|nr:hypothetical protein [Candidatus Thermoplasmatota archaeon]
GLLGQLSKWHIFWHTLDKTCYTNSMNKQITITSEEFDVLTDIFASIAELDMDEVLTDEVTFDQLWDKVLNAKEVV